MAVSSVFLMLISSLPAKLKNARISLLRTTTAHALFCLIFSVFVTFEGVRSASVTFSELELCRIRLNGRLFPSGSIDLLVFNRCPSSQNQ